MSTHGTIMSLGLLWYSIRVKWIHFCCSKPIFNCRRSKGCSPCDIEQANKLPTTTPFPFDKVVNDGAPVNFGRFKGCSIKWLRPVTCMTWEFNDNYIVVLLCQFNKFYIIVGTVTVTNQKLCQIWTYVFRKVCR